MDNERRFLLQTRLRNLNRKYKRTPKGTIESTEIQTEISEIEQTLKLFS